MHLQNNTVKFNNLHFKSRYDKYFDKLEDDSFDTFKYIEVKNPAEAVTSPLPGEYFMRNYELFNPHKDFVDYSYRHYSEDDVELADNLKWRNVPQDYLNCSRYTESGFDDTVILKPQKPIVYSADNAYDNQHESFQTRLDEGFKRNEISTIYHSALVDKGVDYNNVKCIDFNLAKTGFNLLKSGKPINEVAHIMEGSKIQLADGSAYYKPELFNFLMEYPDCRSFVVEKKKNSEVFHRDVAESFREIKEVCRDDKELESVVKTCQIKKGPNSVLDPTLTKLCLDMIKEDIPMQQFSKIIKDSKLNKWDDSQVFSENLFEFLKLYPNARSVVVDSHGESETFNKEVAEAYKTLSPLTTVEPEVFKSIIDSCSLRGKVNNGLVGLAANMLIKEPNWSEKHSKIMNAVVRINSKGENVALNKSKFSIATLMSKGDYGISSIYDIVVLDLKNVELCR